MTYVGEVVGPRIHKLEDVIAPACTGHVQADRAAAFVYLGDGIDGVIVDRDKSIPGAGQARGVPELVEGCGRHAAYTVLREADDPVLSRTPGGSHK